MENNMDQVNEPIDTNNGQNTNTNTNQNSALPNDEFVKAEETTKTEETTMHSGYTKMENHPNDFDDFTEPKSSSKGWIIILVLFLILIGGGLVYYFVIDSPKTIFNNVAKNILTVKDSSKTEDTPKSILIDSDLTYNIKSTNSSNAIYEPYFEIFNNLKYNFQIGMNVDENLAIFGLNTTYKNDTLFNLEAMMDAANNHMYLDLHDLYNQKLEINLEEPSSENDEDSEDLKVVMSSLSNSFKEALDKANYSKKIVKLNGEYVKKITLNIDNTFIDNLGTKLVHDEKFIASVSSLFTLTEEEIIDSLNQMMAENYQEELSLYLTPFGNDVKMVEFASSQDSLKVWQEGEDKYTFEITIDYNLTYKGSLTVKEENDSVLVSATITAIPLGITIECNEKLTVKENVTIPKMDVTNSKKIETLTEEDGNTILKNLLENKAMTSLLEDTGLDELLSSDAAI